MTRAGQARLAPFSFLIGSIGVAVLFLVFKLVCSLISLFASLIGSIDYNDAYETLTHWTEVAWWVYLVALALGSVATFFVGRHLLESNRLKFLQQVF